MNNLEELDKLNTFKEKGIISEEEFQQQKKILLNQPQMGNKSQLCYVLLAFFFGVLGVHNFYAGRWKRGLAQLLITLLTLFVGCLITGVWVIINIFAIHTDGKGNEFQPCPVAKYICGILGIVEYIWVFFALFGILAIGGAAGYTVAMNKYRANEIVSYALRVQLETIAQNSMDEGQPTTKSCEDLLAIDTEVAPFVSECLSFPDGRIQITVNDEAVKRAIQQTAPRIQENSNGDLVLSSP